MTIKYESAHLRACIMLEQHGFFEAEKIITLLNANGFRIVPKYYPTKEAAVSPAKEPAE